MALVAQLRNDLALCETRRQEEAHDASERIDALSAKLRYLAAEAAAAARERAAGVPAAAAEKRLAERDEKIALLVEEGEQLARNELKLQTAIKRLRLQAAQAADARSKAEAAEKALSDERDRVVRLADAEKRATERARAAARAETEAAAEAEALRRDRPALEAALADAKAALLARSRHAADADADARARAEALEAEQRSTAELRAQIERAQAEAATVDETLRAEIAQLRSKTERAAERARVREAELKAEQSVGVSRLDCCYGGDDGGGMVHRGSLAYT